MYRRERNMHFTLIAALAAFPVAAKGQQAGSSPKVVALVAPRRSVTDVFLGKNVPGPYMLSWKAIEDGTDPSPQAVAAMEALFRDRQVRVLLYNSQATSPITDRMRQLADENGIPVVPVTETLPQGMTFQQWQLGQVRALARALGG